MLVFSEKLQFMKNFESKLTLLSNLSAIIGDITHLKTSLNSKDMFPSLASHGVIVYPMLSSAWNTILSFFRCAIKVIPKDILKS